MFKKRMIQAEGTCKYECSGAVACMTFSRISTGKGLQLTSWMWVPWGIRDSLWKKALEISWDDLGLKYSHRGGAQKHPFHHGYRLVNTEFFSLSFMCPEFVKYSQENQAVHHALYLKGQDQLEIKSI